jgi:UDP-N-acetylglucosamine--N-acetylmuramyl-(pentapeptide) pyrophosphoryl-undecaprenol N-acetylglucosamine transferase
MKVLFAGGGTGGHIFPAIAVADELRKIDGKAEILFVGAKGRIEEKIVPANNYELKTIDIKGFNRKNLLKNVSLIFKSYNALRTCYKILKEFRPDVVAGTGGFVSGPVVYAALKKKIPTLIQEGNSFPGIVTKYLSSKVNKVVISFDETLEYLKRKDNVIKIFYPVRFSLNKIDKTEAKIFFKLGDNKTLFIFGGSQGARGINEAVKKIYKDLYKENVNIIWQTGKKEFDEIKNITKEFSDKIKIFEFIDKMQYAYSAADLVLCRAGISSIMELAYLKIPAILMPFPHSAEDHQVKNALSLEKKDACILVRENEGNEKLYNIIIKLINDDIALRNLSENINKFSDNDSAKKIAKEIIQLI